MPSNGTGDPTLTLPSSEEVSAGSTTPISGISYSDSFAASNPGQLYLDITDSSGTLSATDSEGAAPGSGSDAITLSASYADLTDILNSLTYTASSAPGSDTISFDIWDQAGIETTGTIPVGIAAAGGGTTETWTGATSGDWNTASNWSGGTVPSSNDTAVITDITQTNVPTLATATPVGETIIVTQGATNDVVAGELNLSGATINSLLEAQGVGNTSVSNGLTIASVGTVTSGANSILNIYGPEESIENNGLLTAAAGGKLNLIAGPPASQGTSSLTNNGSIVANGGSVNIESISSFPGALPDWDINNGFGTIVTENGGAVTVNGTIDGGQIVFNGTASLTLEQPQALIGGAELFDFGPGDQIDLIGSAYGTIAGFSGNALEIGTAGSIERIPFSGGFGLGNFEDETTTTGSGNALSIIAFAYPGMASGVTNPDITAPAVDTIAHGATLSLGSVAVTYMNNGTIDNAGSISLTIDAGSGTLYMNGATGSGTNQISTGMISVAQANADLATLNYVAGAGASSDTVSIDAAAASSQTMRAIPITVAGSVSSGPTLTEPSSEDIAAGGTVAVSGNYSDSFAQSNPGQLFLGITDSTGTLSATDASGNPVSGSGTSSIALNTDYTDLNAVLKSLTYTAGAGTGSDAISFDIWNQAGVETTDTVPVTVTSGGGSGETWFGAVSSDWDTAGNWSGGSVPVSGDTVTIPSGTPNNSSLSDAVLTGESITLAGTGNSGPLVDFNNVTLGAGTDLSASGQPLLPGTVIVGGTLTVNAGAVIEPTSPTGLTLDPATSGATVVNDGSITNAGSGGFLWFGLNVVNNGVVAATHAGGSIDIEGLLTNNGTVLVDNTGIIFDGGISGGVVTFTGPGAITAGQTMTFENGASVSGFGQGDLIHMFSGDVGGSISFTGGTLDISSASGTLLEAIPMTGSLGLGNFLFQTQSAAKAGSGTGVLYAPDGGFANQGTNFLDISAPAAVSVTQGNTLALNDVSIANVATLTLDIFASSGMLSMNGASGSGTNHLTISSLTSESQINSDLASLTYTPAAGASDATVKVTIDTPVATGGTTEAARYIPITINGSGGGGSGETWTGAVSSDWNTAGNWSGGVVPTSGDTVVTPGGTANSPSLSNATISDETITLNSSGTVDFSNVTLGAGSVLEGSGAVEVGGALIVANGATMAPSNLDVSGGNEVLNDGLIINAGTNGEATFNDGLVNNGTMIANGGVFLLQSLTNNGSVDLTQGEIQVAGTVYGGTITDDGPGAYLRFVSPMALAGGASIAGFGPDDEISVPSGNGLDFSNLNNGTLDVTNGTTLVEAIPLAGSYAAGNFEISQEPQPVGVVTVVVYAPNGETSNVPLVSPDISAPASGTVAAQGTLGLGSVSLSEGIQSLTITATSGTLYMSGASGSGTDQLTIGSASQSAVNADLATLSYVAGATSGNAQIEITATESANPAGTPTTSRYIPVLVTGSASGGPALTEPSSETVSPSGTVAVSGSYSDSFAQGNPGQLYLSISDSSGTLSATDASGNPVSGSGTNSIALSTDYVDVNAILAGLHYTAGSAPGTDQISFQVWNQAGAETTGKTAVTIDPPGGSTMASVMQPGANELASNFSTGIANTPTLQASAPSSAFGLEQQTPVVGVMPIGH